MAARKKTRRSNVLRGKPLEYPAGVAARYEATLKGMVKDIYAEAHAAVRQERRGAAFDEHPSQTAAGKRVLLKAQKRFDKLFANPLSSVEEMVNGVKKSSATSIEASLLDMSDKLAINAASIFDETMRESLEASIQANVQLIKSLGEEAIDRIAQSVYSSIAEGNGLSGLIEDLKEKEGMSARRARNIALDQTRKTFSRLNQLRLEKLGVDKFEWLHSGGGEHPRKDHVAADGKVYRFDDPPPIGDNGEAVLPGQAINCKCKAIPVLELDDGGENAA